MGTHASYESAFLLPLEQFLAILKPEHLAGIQHDAINLMQHRVRNPETCTNIYDLDELDLVVPHLQRAESIEDVRTFLNAAVQEALDSCNDDSQEAYYSFEDHFVLQLTFQCICHVVLPIQPKCLAILNEEDVDMGDFPPIGVPLLKFDFSDCFLVEMSEGGHQLARTLGESTIKPTEWTSLG
ncbi:hypothetical protein C5Y96_03175 [Blastopirellula marina]|uniref:Uncharacterized protein n=1 Tax=Blastopirellula marina TaxID=124 RepID=A0A2S8G360_9BACT|nr:MULTISPECIES: hypothetical protein [Pirellulaceae]PQO38888.1 hypothetical protein C5Y96_03175 [Blastopirellula marina]RCS55196.1 hypothetical protein DTL36_03180 [Bremerella cremea]